jgi:hypothetical protein
MNILPRIIRLVSLVAFSALYSQETNILLRRPWIPTVAAEEDQSYNKIQSKIKNAQSFVIKQDRWGRNFKLKANGHIEYLLDDLYFKKIPDKENTLLAFHEAMTLRKNGFWLDSLHLLEGILFCERLNKKNSSQVTTIERLATREKNEIINTNSDKRDRIITLSDPYGCYLEDKLKIESSSYSYNFDLSSQCSWIYFSKEDEISEKTESISYQFNYLVKNIKDDPSKKLSEEEKFLQTYKLANNNELYLKKDKVLLFIGLTKEKKPLFNQENYFLFWDTKRGLTEATKRSLNFKRNKLALGYQSKFSKVNRLGVLIEFNIKEYYYWKRGKGIFLALSYPSFLQEEIEKDWEGIIQSFKVKDADVRLY